MQIIICVTCALQVYMEYIRCLPINDTPEMFGLHDNANITFAVNETYQLLNGIVKLQPKTKSGGGRSQEEVNCLHVNLPSFAFLNPTSWYSGTSDNGHSQ